MEPPPFQLQTTYSLSLYRGNNDLHKLKTKETRLPFPIKVYDMLENADQQG